MTNSQIETLKNECGEAGDHLGVVCCMVALGEEPGASEEGTYLAEVFAQESGRWTQERPSRMRDDDRLRCWPRGRGRVIFLRT